MLALLNGYRCIHPVKIWILLLILAMALGSCSTQSMAKAGSSSSGKAIDKASAHTLNDLPPVAQKRIRAQLATLPYTVRNHSADNPAMGYAAQFDPGQVRINNTRAQGPAWDMRLHLAAYGYEGQLQPVQAAKISTEKNKVTYHRGAVKEWYVNTAAGIEQGFTLETPPGQKGSAPMQFRVAIEGGVQPRISKDQMNIDLYNASGRRVLTYRKLKVVDAHGKVLPASMTTMASTAKGEYPAILIAVNDAAATYPIVVDPLLSAPKLTPPDGDTWDYFGYAVSIYGDIAAVGAHGDDDGGIDAGSVYIFERNYGGIDNWGQVAKLTDPDGVSSGRFGFSVSNSGDRLVVGVISHVVNTVPRGVAYIYNRDGIIGDADGINLWTREAMLYPVDSPYGDNFGRTVSIFGDRAVVGAPYTDVQGPVSGSVFIFVRDGLTDDPDGIDYWTQEAQLLANDGATEHAFGYAVSIFGDRVAVGTPFDDSILSNAGSMYIFERDGLTDDPDGIDYWTQEAKIFSFDRAEADYFGYSVSISGDTVVAGAYTDDDLGPESGSAYIFERDGVLGDPDGIDNWNLATKLTAVDGGARHTFGSTVSISGDIVVVGAPVDDEYGPGTGSAYLYMRDQGGTDNWGLVDKLNAAVGTPYQAFGIVANSGDQVIVGAYNALNNGTSSGAAYIMDGIPGIIVNPTSGLSTTEAGDSDTITVELETNPYADVTIDLNCSDTSECSVSPTTLTFTSADWDVAQTVTVSGVDDLTPDGDQSFTVTLAAAQSSGLYNGIDPDDVTGTNTDDDIPGVTINPTSGLITAESGTDATFTIVLDLAPTADVTIDLTSGDATEGTVLPASLTFTSANWDQTQTVTVTGVDDALDDGDQAYTIEVGTCVSTDASYDGIDPDDVSVTNTDDDTAGVTITPTSGLTTSEAGTSATFTVVLTSEPTADVAMLVTSGNSDEGTVSPTTLTFTSANWDQAQTVTVTGVDDALDDGDQAYTIEIGACVSTDAGYDGIDPDDVSATNTDDDTAGVTITPTSGLTTSEAGTSATFTVVLTSQPTADVATDLTSSATGEGTVSPASLTFTSATWDQTQTVTVTGVDDAIDDGDQAYTVEVGACVSSDASYDGIDPDDVTVTNTDDETAGVTVTPTSGLTTSEAGTSATFTVVLTSEPTADVATDLTSSDTGEGTVSPASLTFTSANWDQARTVTVTGVDDAFADGSQAYTITTSACASTDAGYSGINPADVAVTNTDNDTAGVTVSPTGGLTTSEAGASDTFTVVLNTQPQADVTMDLASSDTGEGTISTTSLTFTSANWDQAQSVTVTGEDDAAMDGAQAYTILIAACVSSDGAYSGMDPADVSVTNSDNDTAGVTVTPTSGLTTSEDGDSATFTVVLNTAPLNGVTINLSSSDDTEGTVSPSVLTFTPVNWDQPQTVTVTGVDDDDVDGDQTYTVTTSACVSGDAGYDGMDPADVTVTNTDTGDADSGGSGGGGGCFIATSIR